MAVPGNKYIYYYFLLEQMKQFLTKYFVSLLAPHSMSESGHVISLLTTRRWLTSLRKEFKMRHHRIRLHSSSFPGPFLQSPYTSHKGLLANIHQADSWLAPWLLAFLLPWRLFLQKSTKMVLCPDPLVSSDHRGPLITLSPFVLIFFSVLAITTIFQIISLFHILIFFSVH